MDVQNSMGSLATTMHVFDGVSLKLVGSNSIYIDAAIDFQNNETMFGMIL